MISRPQALVGALVLLAACNEVFPFQVTTGRLDVGHGDTRRVDAGSLDGKPSDASKDKPNQSGDVAVDQGDAAPTGDAIGGEAIPSGPCGPGATKVPWKPDMVICQGINALTLNPCAASQFCAQASGWHMCTASEYLARGGKVSSPPDGGEYWLAECARDGEEPLAPSTGAICPDCTSVSQTKIGVAWPCMPGDMYHETPWTPLGVTTSAYCGRLGEDAPTWEAFWEANSLNFEMAGAACCK